MQIDIRHMSAICTPKYAVAKIQYGGGCHLGFRIFGHILVTNEDNCLKLGVQRYRRSQGARCIPRPVVTGHVSCVCDWLSDANGLDSGDRSWICNAAEVTVTQNATLKKR